MTEERARVLSRFGEMTSRNFTTGLVAMLGSMQAKNLEELNEALRQTLRAAAKGTPKN